MEITDCYVKLYAFEINIIITNVVISVGSFFLIKSGIKLARLTALPQEILDRAEELLNSYIEEENISNDDDEKTNNRKTMTMSDTGDLEQIDRNISLNFQNLQRQVSFSPTVC